jgi:hypothetical protein
MAPPSFVSLAATYPHHATGHQDYHQHTEAARLFSRFDRARARDRVNPRNEAPSWTQESRF